MGQAVALNSVRKLINDIVALHTEAKKSLVLLYWKIGQRIVEVEQDGAVRAEYGTGLLQSLSEELTKKLGQGFSDNNLERMRKFYLTHPKSPTSGKLEWSKYVELLSVEDPKKMKRLEERAKRGNLSSRKLRELARKSAAPESPGAGSAEDPLPPLKSPTGLKLNTFKDVGVRSAALLEAEGGRVSLDCGFFVCRSVTKEEAARVTLTDKPSYTYAATVERVIDGDTLLVLVDLGFDTVVREKLRLRGINTPELKTPEGEKAKAYAAGLLPPGTPLVLKSHQTDNYGRFVADVLYLKLESSPEEIIARGVYLNQQLLDDGIALRMAE